MNAADFISPTGELTEELFPGVDLEETITAWIADALTRSSNPNAQTSWVLHRAYATVANRFHAGLASESKAGASASRDPSQFRYWARKSADALRAYRATITPSSVTEVRAVW